MIPGMKPIRPAAAGCGTLTYHFGDWLIPSMVLGNPDGNAMGNTALATMHIVAPAYYAFSAKNMSEIAGILGREEDAAHFAKVYENVRQAFIEEYVHEDGTVSTYSYNHYAFGCVGDWMYRHIGGLQILEPGYKKYRVAPALDCGLAFTETDQETPYGRAAVEWEIIDGKACVRVDVPPNASAEICLPGIETQAVGSGSYSYLVDVK